MRLIDDLGEINFTAFAIGICYRAFVNRDLSTGVKIRRRNVTASKRITCDLRGQNIPTPW